MDDSERYNGSKRDFVMSVSMKKQDRSCEQGSLILVLAAVMVLVGVLVTMGLDTIRVQDPIDRNLATLKKMEFVH